ncbi:MAG: conserved membrane protein of unknown function [Nitrospira sp.]
MEAVEIALCYNGLLALCLAMPKHYRQLFSEKPTDISRWTFRTTGWLAVAASFFSAVGSSGWSFGPVEWVGLIGVIGLALIFLWPFRPGAAAILGGLVLLVALARIAT